ncbi:MAG: hypothetical protein ACK47C_00605 [Paracoccaceae bacterium]|jgi:hypothetical protein
MIDWQTLFDGLKGQAPDQFSRDYFEANKDMVVSTLQGNSPHGGAQQRHGLCVVFNLSALNVIRFLLSQRRGPGFGTYLNRHSAQRPVGRPHAGPSIRDRIDAALSAISTTLNLVPLGPIDAHYGAMELNGTGIRYFGDICLVLRADNVDPKTLILLRNSYDLNVTPVSRRFGGLNRTAQDDLAQTILKDEWAGEWLAHGHFIAGKKIMDAAPETTRRMTTAQISQGVLDDEDYVEVVRAGSFTSHALLEIRQTAEDAAAEALIGDRSRIGHTPSAAHALWRHRRRAVARLAQEHALPIRVVTTSGRTR